MADIQVTALAAAFVYVRLFCTGMFPRLPSFAGSGRKQRGAIDDRGERGRDQTEPVLRRQVSGAPPSHHLTLQLDFFLVAPCPGCLVFLGLYM